MQELSPLIAEATRRVPEAYFRVKIDGGDPVYRERVYCYELYHQLRCLWPEQCDFLLNGELDKAAHPILRQLGADYAKPDLLVHAPGRMDRNYAILEVKSSRAQKTGIAKDLNTLALFRSNVGYQRAIYLLFGEDVEAAATRVVEVAQQIEGLPQIELWLHGAAGRAATPNLSLEPTRVGEPPLAAQLR